MSQYNLEFFDLSLNHIHHDVIDEFSIDDDYLSPSETTVEIGKTDKLSIRNLVWIKGSIEFLGIITKVSTKDYVTEISFKPFISLFDQDVLIDTNVQNNGTALEALIANKIREYWIESSDSLQNISTLTVSQATSTTSWGMNLKSDDEDKHHCIVGFYSVIIANAMSKYGIALDASINFNNKTINIRIGKITTAAYKIDADLKNVQILTFSLKEPSSDINKLEVWNTDNYTQKRYYYLHPDGTYSTANNNRITPVVLEVSSATPSEDVDNPADRITFAQAANEVAISTFSGMEWTNLIELEMMVDDQLVKPLDLKYGQNVEIIHDGSVYTSILTGKNLSRTVTLVFGTVRHDLTKILKSGG